jgi:response regulator RpfG family c-di-GMP phosphodiesterase
MNEVLIVDDDAGCRQLLRRLIDRADVTVAEAVSAEQALLIASTAPPDIALCDVNLPGGQDGVWLASQLHRLFPTTVVIMTTGVQRFEAAVAGLRAGIRDYLVKPFTPGQLREAFAAGLVEHRLRRSHAELAPGSLSDPQIPRALSALDAIVASEAPGIAAHTRRVGEFAVRIAAAMGASDADQRDIAKAARLRDVARPEVHAATRHIPALGAAEEIALTSAEKFDGTGLPRGLKGTQIPLGARILAAATAFDTLVFDRSCGPWVATRAMDVLCGSRAHEFDPAVLQALDRLHRIGPDSTGSASQLRGATVF